MHGIEVTDQNRLAAQLENKQHDLICPVNTLASWIPILKHSCCVCSFAEMDAGQKYQSVRSEELAHSIHIQKKEKGVLDLEPFRDGWNAVTWGVGIGCTLFGLGYLVNALKRSV